MKTRGLYAIVDPAHLGAHSALDLTRKVLRGGCAALQLRAKNLSDRERLDLARAMRALCKEHDVPFVMNDRLDLALLAGADGVHLGQDDLPLLEARTLAPSMWIGISTHSLAQAKAAARDGADIIGYGPVFTTASKDKPDPVVGLPALREVVRAVSIPVVAIGGITVERVPEVVKTGVPYLAVISALSASTTPDLVAKSIHAQIAAPP
ncbi:MAG: thiamine phosphate synthase [Sandaracinaceae bacterium]|jgi:thiamine-phosphate pyrophosphorylase|nr:thiamine phosphate synthase [Sandaracinaceae bacterium]